MYIAHQLRYLSFNVIYVKIPIVFKDISFPNLRYFSLSISHLAIYMIIDFANHILSHEYVYLDKSNEIHVVSVLPIYYCILFCRTSPCV